MICERELKAQCKTGKWVVTVRGGAAAQRKSSPIETEEAKRVT